MHTVAVLKGLISDDDLANRLGSPSDEVSATATHRITPSPYSSVTLMRECATFGLRTVKSSGSVIYSLNLAECHSWMHMANRHADYSD